MSIYLGTDIIAGMSPDMVGATASADGQRGLVPAPSAGAQERFLRGDGSWQEVERVESIGSEYIKYASGLIIQWGFAKNGTSNTITITFPTAFTSTTYAISATSTNYVSNTTGNMTVSNRTTTSCTITTKRANEDGVWWMAIGR